MRNPISRSFSYSKFDWRANTKAAYDRHGVIGFMDLWIYGFKDFIHVKHLHPPSLVLYKRGL